ncbi:CDP-glucose 4,6-dehydratase [Leisingera sp. ANG-M7]|uniref:CDP-glucose 4,6-dehydratase n=1 Tax=Leisingera sp. ANG-M7 TaxID=1577902 RepID=UPI00057F4D30|nr:CDP-glucose 4,6-dehydratase [Leisingera sp. ANG-M7]KIC35469.1 CDP-glucose 4,6-dehydratase [Leisingera sp. ANG-M7]
MQGISSGFWRNRRVFVTGHTGFKGSWLSSWLLDLGANLRGFALPPATEGLPAGTASLFDELDLASRMDHICGDTRDEAALRAAIEAFRPEVMLHLAAQPIVRKSYADPVGTYSTNVMGTVHVLNICRDLPGLRSIVVVSSDKCYENREQVWGYRETDQMGGHDPYSSSKGCTELVTDAFRSSYFPPDQHSSHGVSLASARAGNVIGGGDWSVDRLIPDAVRALRGGRQLDIRCPQATRPWQHVLEPLSGYLLLAETGATDPGKAAQGWNFGPDAGSTRTVAETVDALAEGLGHELSWSSQRCHGGLHEAGLLALDCTKARHLLGWRPKLAWRDMIGMTAAWYKSPDLQARNDLVRSQISSYTAKADE